MLDCLKIYETLKTGQLSDVQAQAMTQALRSAESEIASDWRSALLELKTEIRDLKASIDQRFEQQTAFIRETFASKVELARLESRLTHRMFGFWIGQWAVTFGVILAVLKIWRR